MSDPSQPDKPETPLETISRVTGLSRPVMDEIWQKVKANQKLLEACKGHDFNLPAEQRGQLTTRWKCSRCGGIVDMQCKRWYELGLKHGMAKG